MPFELSVNIEYMFHEAGERLEDRVAAAAAAGYRKVEMFNPAGRDIAAIRAALDAHGCTMISTCTDPRTQLVMEANHDAFRESFAAAARDTAALGCRNIVVPSGTGVPFMKRPVQLAIVAKAIASVLPVAEAHGLTILLEPVNIRFDHPGSLFNLVEDATTVIAQVGSPRVKLLFDIYHTIVEREDPFAILPQVIGEVGHIQLADAPGRGEPGSGKIDWPAILGLLRQVGYAGPIGVECSPTQPDTGAALAWFRELCAAA